MRNDMAKVIVERPRNGRAYAKATKNKGSQKLPSDLSQIGLGKLHALTAGRKGLNENLSPLRRYLEAQIGRPWNKVWSEISANLKPSSTVQQHVRDHVPDFVAVNTRLIEGEVWIASGYGRLWPLKDGHPKLFVDPRSGLLRRNPHHRARSARHRADRMAQREAVAARMVKAGADRQYHRLADGAWWEVTLAKIPTREVPVKSRFGDYRVQEALPFSDVVSSANLSDLPLSERYDRTGVYAVAKRQLSARTAKRLKLGSSG